MSKGLIFWILMLIWLVFGIWQAWPNPNYVIVGGNLMLFILLGLLGWHCFGPPVQ